MVLQLFNQAQQFVCLLDDLDKKLGYYSPEDGYGIHVRRPDSLHRVSEPDPGIGADAGFKPTLSIVGGLA